MKRFALGRDRCGMKGIPFKLGSRLLWQPPWFPNGSLGTREKLDSRLITRHKFPGQIASRARPPALRRRSAPGDNKPGLALAITAHLDLLWPVVFVIGPTLARPVPGRRGCFVVQRGPGFH